MDKKGITAIALAIATLVVWQVYFAPKYTPPQKPEVQAPQPDTAAPAAAQPVETPAAELVEKKEEKPAVKEPADAGKTEKISSPAVEYVFTHLGGGISRAALLEHLGDKEGKVTLNEYGAEPIGGLSALPGQGSQADYAVTVNAEAGEVLCEHTTPEQVRIVKKFTLPKTAKDKEAYLVGLDVSFTNCGKKEYQSNGYYIHAGSAALIHKKDMPMNTSFDWYRGKHFYKDVNWFGAGRVPLIGVQTSGEKAFFAEKSPRIAWAGVRNQYFATIVSTPDQNGAAVWSRRFPVTLDDTSSFGIEGALGMPGFALKPGETARQHFNLWIGPKQYTLLKKLGNDEDEIMNFGMFKVVSETLLSSMNWLHGKLWGSYAAAIIVLTLIIKTALWPMQNASTKSMKKMQALQPKMKELQAKYKDDPTRMNQETMKLYKEYGVNPVSGCLPMLVQLPIFFGFYSMLGTAIELRNSKFLWVKDLSQPDTVFHLAGIPVNILPLCMAVTMLWQMSLTPKSGDQSQQKIMMFMPLIFIFFCYNFASALALYWTVQNIFSIGQLYLTRNQAAPALQKVAMARRKR
jgi:YidC/Oxa1 family membrane protein insertase